jgi:cytoskeletal protein CcmA (bactofilin family)
MQPASPTPAPPVQKRHRSWATMVAHANTVSGVVTLLATLAILGGIVGFVYGHNAKQVASSTKQNSGQALTPEDISKLSQVGSSLGSTGQTLSIGADSLFRGKVDVGGDLSIAGHLNANGPVVLSQLNITGTTALTGLNVGSNLTVGGTTTLQKGLTVADLVTINSNLSVAGTASVGSLNAGTVAVKSISISGPIVIGHIQTQGTVPNASPGTAVGGGGTVSNSGNDASGTININTGNTPPAGVLITIVFRAAYSNTTHIMLTPLTGAAANTPVYVSRNATGFQVHVDSPPPAGATLSYDYFVTQ